MSTVVGIVASDRIVAARFDPWTGDGVDVEVVHLAKETRNGDASE